MDSTRARLCGGGETEACRGWVWGVGVGLIEPDSVRFLDDRAGGWSSSSSSSSSWSWSERALKSQGRLVSRSPSNWGENESREGLSRERGGTYPHGTLNDGDDIVGAVLVETRPALLVVEDDDGDVDGAEDAELVGLFEEPVLPLERVSDENSRGARLTLRKVTDLFRSCWGEGQGMHAAEGETTDSDGLDFDLSSAHD